MLELAPRTRTVLGIVLLVLGAALAGLEILGVVEVALVVAIPVAILLLATGTVLIGTAERGPGGRPVCGDGIGFPGRVTPRRACEPSPALSVGEPSRQA